MTSTPVELDTRQQYAVELYVEGTLSNEQIAQAAGYSSTSALNVFLRSRRGQEAVRRAVSKATILASAKALGTVLRLAESAKNERVKLDAALAVLDNVGWLHPEDRTDEPAAPGTGEPREVRIVIDLGDSGDRARVIETQPE